MKRWCISPRSQCSRDIMCEIYTKVSPDHLCYLHFRTHYMTQYANINCHISFTIVVSVRCRILDLAAAYCRTLDTILLHYCICSVETIHVYVNNRRYSETSAKCFVIGISRCNLCHNLAGQNVRFVECQMTHA